MLAVGAFVGFESSSSLGIEARSRHWAIPRAILVTVLAAGVLCILAAYAQVLGFGSLGTLATFGYLLAYVLVSIAAAIFLARRKVLTRSR